jgi:hypothetical protein
MSRSIVISEDKTTGKLKYVTGTASFEFTPIKEKATTFKAENVLPALRYAKAKINPADTRVYTASA